MASKIKLKGTVSKVAILLINKAKMVKKPECTRQYMRIFEPFLTQLSGKRALSGLALSCLLGLSGRIMALPLPTDPAFPMHIDSDSMQFDNKTGIAVHVGKVVMRQGEAELLADKVTVKRDSNGEIETLVAEGNLAQLTLPAAASKPKMIGQAHTITYEAKTQTVTLSGEAHLTRGNDVMQSESIDYQMQKETISAKPSPGARTRIVLQPRGS